VPRGRGERRVVGTGAGDQHMVDRGGQFVEELREALEVGGIEGYSARRGKFARNVLKPFEISRGEQERRPLGSR